MMDITKEISNVIILCEDEAKKSNSAYFKTITKILLEMKNAVVTGNLNLKQQELYSTGLTKIVLDNYSFAMSELGTSILEISNVYAKYKVEEQD